MSGSSRETSDYPIRGALDVPSDDIRDCLNEAFSDYLIKFPAFDAAGWKYFLSRQGCELALSRVGVQGTRVVAFALVTVRDTKRWRVAVMGARPAARGTGIAGRLLDDVIARAAASGKRSVELEVFAQNERAFRLYRSRGLNPACALLGFEGVIGHAGNMHDVQNVTLAEAAEWADALERQSAGALPWQVCGDAIRALPAQASCWRLDEAQMVWIEAPGTITVQSLLDRNTNYVGAAKLLAALRASCPDTTLRAPQLQADHGPALAFRQNGWREMELSQRLMISGSLL